MKLNVGSARDAFSLASFNYRNYRISRVNLHRQARASIEYSRVRKFHTVADGAPEQIRKKKEKQKGREREKERRQEKEGARIRIYAPAPHTTSLL